MMTRSEVRALIRSYIDEPTEVRWTDATLNTLINLSIEQVQNFLVSTGSNLFHQTATITATNGVVNLSVTPVKIVALTEISGTTRNQIYATRPKDTQVLNSYTGTLELTYVPKAILPTQDSDIITYGDGYNGAIDNLIAVQAARFALITDNEPRGGLEALKSELEANIKSLTSMPSSFVMPMRAYRSSLNYYLSSQNTIQLVSRY